MTSEQLQARIDELKAHRAQVKAAGEEAEARMKQCANEYMGVSGGIQELERLLSEISKPAPLKAD